ncbi:MAG: glycosyltransferase family 4 protein, partial [Nitrospirae bacterium]|nr:glycosyltransferase family 4 protein [Nitrospirota bacterium]
ICFVSLVTCWHGMNGGMEVHGRLLARALVAGGHDVSIISSRHPSGKEVEVDGGVNLYYLAQTEFGSQRGNWSAACARQFDFLQRQKPFDILCSQQAVVPGQVVRNARAANVPLVMIMEGLEGLMLLSEIRQMMSHRKDYGQLGRRLFSFLYYYLRWELPLARTCDAFIAVSDEVARSISRWCGVSAAKVNRVYNGVDVTAFAPDRKARAAIRTQYGVMEDERLIVFLSHVTRQKGLHLLLKCMPAVLAQQGRTKVLVAGTGDYLDEAKRLVDRMGLQSQVLFAGHVPHERTVDYLNAADLSVLPTLRQEGLPFSLVEAMACQKPVIASRIGGIPSVVIHGLNGLLVAPGDSHELGQAIVRLLADTELAERLSRKARETVVAGYSLENMVQGTLDVFETVLSKQRIAVHRRQDTHVSS